MRKTIPVALAVMILVSASLAQRQVEVVAEVSHLNVTGTQGGTLFTPAQTGVFRVNFMIQCTGNGNEHSTSLVPEFDWTDDNGPEIYPYLLAAPDGKPRPPLSFVFVIKATAGEPIHWGVQERPEDTSTYDVYLALERIGPKVP